MATNIQICNSALIKIGAERISSLSENKKSAILCNEQLPKIKEMILADSPWKFALRRATLAQLADTPAFEWAYAYQLPTDCLRPYKPYPSNVQYKVEGRTILTNESELNLQYISSSVDVADYPAYFAEAVAMALAADIAYALVASSKIQENAFQAAKMALARAKSHDSQQGTPDVLEADDWTNSRY